MAYFEDDSVDFSDTNLIDFCKKNDIKIEKRGHGLTRFTADKKKLQQMIQTCWGEPADYIDFIKESSSMIMKELLSLNEAEKRNGDALIHDLAAHAGISKAAAKAIFIGGGEVSKSALDKLEKDGFDTAGGWAENQKWFKKHGISKADYNVLVKLSESVQLDEAKEYDPSDLGVLLDEIEEHVNSAAGIMKGPFTKLIKQVASESDSDEITITAGEVTSTIKKLLSQIDRLKILSDI